MKKFVLFLTLFLIFIPFVKADITDTQANDLALFTTNFVNEGNKRIGTDGFPLFAYMQGQARIDGYQSKLYNVKYDYNGKILVNAYKWTFDCASFASFIYYKTFNLVLTNYYTNKVDEYSGLRICGETSNPYQVHDFFDDASRKEHFYFVKSDVSVSNLNYADLKKGDLIIIKGSHIMIYIGNGKIAHASSGAISSSNLGLEIIDLNSKYASKNVYVIRIKDNVINPSLTCNKTIVFPDKNDTVTLISKGNTTEKKDGYPTINYTLSTLDWSKSVDLSLELSDEIGLKSYTFDGSTFSISGKSKSINKTIDKNGTYKLEVKNVNNLVTTKTIKISNVDSTAPIINNIKVVEYENYKQLIVYANDSESGLGENAYSFDSGLTWTENVFNAKELKEYVVVVKDNVGNTTRKTINLKPEEKVDAKINNIIFGDTKGETKKVIITTTICPGCKIAITSDFKIPDVMDDLNNNEYTKYLKPEKYYIWLEYNGKILDNRAFNVKIDAQNSYILYIIGVIVLIPILAFGIIYILRNKKNEI